MFDFPFQLGIALSSVLGVPLPLHDVFFFGGTNRSFVANIFYAQRILGIFFESFWNSFFLLVPTVGPSLSPKHSRHFQRRATFFCWAGGWVRWHTKVNLPSMLFFVPCSIASGALDQHRLLDRIPCVVFRSTTICRRR